MTERWEIVTAQKGDAGGSSALKKNKGGKKHEQKVKIIQNSPNADDNGMAKIQYYG